MKKIEKMLVKGNSEAEIRDALYLCIKEGEITCDEMELFLKQMHETKKVILEF